MASAEEVYPSREGSTIGAFGVDNVTRTWRVYVDSVTDDPVAIFRSLGAAAGGAREGDPHPWTAFQVVLLFFTINRRMPAPKVWEITGVYGPQAVLLATTPAWEPRMQASLETERVYQDINGRPIGTPKYSPIDLTIGPPLPPGVPIFSAKTERGQSSFVLPGFATSPSDKEILRFAEGADRFKGTGNLTLSKIVSTFTAPSFSVAYAAKGMLNVDFFRATTTLGVVQWADPGQMLLVDATADPIGDITTPLYAPGVGPRPQRAAAYRVTLSFKHNPDGWKHKLTHTYKDDAGPEAIMKYSGGENVEEEFDLYFQTSFSGLCNSFGP